MIKGFFFDLDGTLVGTYEADYLAYRDAVKEVTGSLLDRDGYMRLHGMEIGAKLQRLMPGLSDEEVLGIRQAKKRHYYNHVHLTFLNSRLMEFIAQYPQLTHAIVTTAKKDNVAAVMGQHELAKHFPVIISGDDITRHKPDPEAYLLALAQTGLRSEEVIAFEDSASGIASAEAAGIQTVRVLEFAAS